MEYRNPKLMPDGRINCEINHPAYGWIPFTADAADTGALFDVAALHATMAVDGGIQTYTPPSPLAAVPDSVTPRQVRLLLLQQGLLAQVETIMATQEEAVKIAWEYALEFKRNDPLLLGIAASLPLTDQQLDEFFIAASAL